MSKKPTNAELQKALDKANKRIKRLEAALAKYQEADPPSARRTASDALANPFVWPWEQSK